jgi:patatin-like phospholipase/acyl hydrolase
MKAIQAVKKGEKFRLEEDWDEKIDNDLPLPKDYFDLVGGTSTGGYVHINPSSS